MGSTQNLNQLLLTRTDWLSERINAAVKASPYSSITPAQTRLLALMAGKPASISELARRSGVSRQAIHRTVLELEQRGILKVQTDPQRANSKLVEYTELGREVNRHGAMIIQKIEQQIAQQVGTRELERLKHLLGKHWG